jgi:hypothetical protein
MLLTNGLETGTKKHFPMHKLSFIFVYHGMEFENFFLYGFFENLNKGRKLKKRLLFFYQGEKNANQQFLSVHPIFKTPGMITRILE